MSVYEVPHSTTEYVDEYDLPPDVQTRIDEQVAHYHEVSAQTDALLDPEQSAEEYVDTIFDAFKPQNNEGGQSAETELPMIGIDEAIQAIKDEDLERLAWFTSPAADTLWNDSNFRQHALQKSGRISERRKLDKDSVSPELTKVNSALRERGLMAYGLTEQEVKSVTDGFRVISTTFDKDIKDPSTGKLEHKKGDVDPDRVKRFGDAMVSTYVRMEELFHRDPAAVTKLHRQYGIRRFDRYETEALEWQLNHPNEPADVITLLGEDWNDAGALLFWDLGEIYPGKRIVHTEAGGTKEAGEILSAIVENRGGPISELYIQLHANKASALLSEFQDDGEITKENLSQFLPEGIMAAGGRIIFRGCEAGKGIAKDLAEYAKVRVIAGLGFTTGIRRSRIGRGVKLEFSKDSPRHERKTVSFGPNKTRRRLGQFALRGVLGTS